MYSITPKFYEVSTEFISCKIITHLYNGSATPIADLEDADNESGLSEETAISLIELGQTLRRIHTRLIGEGYVISDGMIRKDT